MQDLSPKDTDETPNEVGAVVNLLPAGELDQLAQDTETDKSSKRHDYMRFYEHLLAPYRNQEFSFLELGVGLPSRRAPSLRTWKAYFPKARIIGVDIRPGARDFEEDRIHIEIGNAARPRFLKRVFRSYQPSIILDDASHFWSHQIIGFQTLFPMLPPGGVYIVEDVHTSFLAQTEGSQYADYSESFWSYFNRLQSAVVCAQRHGPTLSIEENRIASWIDAIFVTRKSVAVVKRQSPRRREWMSAPEA
ncbi:SAM-dependent methyltransferase [Epibacterium sp. SM1979]|uniref:SAM-dependent methyltransferase n=1 Tax=Tritonibacter litoralis TaxID=2662264 RepID=A0A843YFQ6_9RHOB|nr:SAM-dependent methyltransferase [Tritonibacter litoralis]MQQ10320.1 SAM-dependent methyltransferase [Tritonibacter litoralis]